MDRKEAERLVGLSGFCNSDVSSAISVIRGALTCVAELEEDNAELVAWLCDEVGICAKAIRATIRGRLQRGEEDEL